MGWRKQRDDWSSDETSKAWTPKRVTRPPSSSVDESLWTAACRSGATWRHLRTDLSMLAAEEQYTDVLEAMAHALRVLAKRLLPDLGRKSITAQLKNQPEAQDLVFLLSTLTNRVSTPAAVDPLQVADPWHNGKGNGTGKLQAPQCGGHVSQVQAERTVQYVTVEKFVEVPRIEYIEKDVVKEVEKLVEKFVEVPRIEYIEKEIVKEVEKLVEEIVEVPHMEYIEKEVVQEIEKLLVIERKVRHDAECNADAFTIVRETERTKPDEVFRDEFQKR